MSAPFIGIGTGRCGTTSLKEILNTCRNVQVVHEVFLQPWEPPYNQGVLDSMIMYLNSEREKIIRGAISLTNIRVIDSVRERIPDLKVIHIYREREKVAGSFTREHQGISRVIRGMEKQVKDSQQSHWINNPWLHPLAGMPEIFPKFETDDCYESYKMYWDYYMDLTFKIENIYHIHIDSLNNDNELNSLYNYLSIPDEDRFYPEQRYFNMGQ